MKALILFYLFIFTCCQAIAQNAKVWFDSAYQAIIIRKDYTKGIEYCNKAIETDPLFAEAWNRRGYAKTMLAQYDAAITDLNEALRIDPKMAKGYFNRGTAFYWKENYAASLPDFEKAAALDAGMQSSDWCERYAYALYRQAQYAKAIPIWDKAIGFNPNNAFNWLNRGLCRYMQQQYDAALPDLNEAIKRKPDFGLSYVYRAEVYKFKKMYREGEADYTLAVKYFPDDSQCWLGLLECRYFLAAYREALSAMDRYVKLDPQNAYVYNLQGLCYLHLKDYQNAVPAFTRALGLDPKEPRYPNNRGYAYFMLGQYRQAIEDYDRGAALLPPKTDPFYRFKEEAVMKLASAAGAGEAEKFNAANYLLEQKKYAHAVTMFTGLIAMNGNDARYYFGRYLAKYGGVMDLEHRWKDAAKAMELDASKPEYFFWLGYEYYLQQKDDYAIKCYDEAMRLGGTYLPGRYPKIIGNGNYKQVILNKRQGGSTVQKPSPVQPGGGTLTPQEIDRFLQLARDEIIAQLPAGATVVEKGVFGMGGKVMKYKLPYNQAYQLIILYPEATDPRVIGSSVDVINCETGGAPGFRRQQCTQTNEDWYTQQIREITFHVMVAGNGPIYYILIHIRA